MKRFFTEHPATVGETYGEHFAFAISVGGRMVGGGLACMPHAGEPPADHPSADRDGKGEMLTIGLAHRRRMLGKKALHRCPCLSASKEGRIIPENRRIRHRRRS